jgi:purine-binding chemotaxis protein CheW
MSTSSAKQYLTFTLGGETFALETERVREVIELVPITRIPQTPPHVRGVINLRGHAVPVVDLRVQFALGDVRDTVNTCIIIVETSIDDEIMAIGAIVDSVREVFEMEDEVISPPPRMGTSIKADFLKGMGKQEDNFIMILDIDRVFSTEELSAIQEIA